MLRYLTLLVLSAGVLLAAACGDGDDDQDATATSTSLEDMTEGPTVPAPTETPAVVPSATPSPPEPTVPPVTNRRDCEAIQGTDYLSQEERAWFLDNCIAPPPPQQEQPPAEQPPPRASCDPSYPDVCIPIGAADYDCAGGSGNGPNYIAGPIRVLPPDPHGLDRDGDGIGCE